MQAAMPVMAQAGLFAGRYGGDSRLGSAAALVTTILCVITVPLWMGSLR
jgi:predicted permease